MRMISSLGGTTFLIVALAATMGVSRALEMHPLASIPQNQSAERARPNDNRTPAGRMLGDTLVLHLTVKAADW
ncbi:MAG: hypothetical protein ACT4P6_03720 [Gemmatimonadaceae bacterium]